MITEQILVNAFNMFWWGLEAIYKLFTISLFVIGFAYYIQLFIYWYKGTSPVTEIEKEITEIKQKLSEIYPNLK